MVYSPTFDTSRAENRQLRVANRLAHSLATGKLKVVYQPEVNLITRQVTALEALCRWHDEELDQVVPDEFIAVAEASGLITQIGSYLLQRVLKDLPLILVRWPKIRVAVNVSGLELALPDFADGVSASVQAVDPQLAQHLELEVTESVFHHNVSVVRNNLMLLRELGLTIAIDDFGTGQSSLARLHTLPFDKIKMDRSFVQALDNPMVQAIVKAMTELAQQFSHSLVVEGIETQAQLQQLMQLGCKTCQGYFLSRPVALEDLLAKTLHFDF